ncbi:hypothetical protein SODALDRAFT_332232 [Sodiomyces alkalinus F11]|uniref:Protein kinase domain-containing protein n=1 Tax=Sodiomyces alkalinus (strain CBS 110278 / VKM F-3762 / F11) TaxID=1314773 RepID=A0A3N2Q003_SODAK|nr:hypothetical protein SODALDRAFT_332232 [Sodiomyces alkalinus F11]ROT40073.1 hypothetical protein SODALDRAFT_332232 [Sodiomyces alkalinus F11]
MELSPHAINSVIHPTAAFLTAPTSVTDSSGTTDDESAVSVPWQESQLNPKNRINSLAPLESPLWRIDGCTSFGSQFYVIPLFMRPIPMRIDVFIPELSRQPHLIRNLLELDHAFHTKDRVRLSRLAISMHILRRLQTWTKSLPDRERYLNSLPFGSRIVFKNLSLDVDQIEIAVAQTHSLEVYQFSVPQLQAAWGHDILLPPCIDIADVRVVEQIHDSTCLVSIDGKFWILKALTSFPKYLYHELKLLLTMKPHPNIVSRPAHLVTKRISFGSKRSVLGFTLEFHRHGTLRDIVPLLGSSGSLMLSEQFKWATQITSALIHHRETTGTFYPDLRLDNIVLSAERDAIMVDFEQRGVWCEFAAPEVNCIEYIRILATASDDDIPADVRQKYADRMEQLMPGYEPLLERQQYTNPPGGYNVSWLSLSPREQGAAEVYMLARVLWCIFEGVSAPQKATIWVSYRWESPLQFPEYRRTPPPVQRLIDQCTKGRRATLDSKVIRQGSRLVLRETPDPSQSYPDAVYRTARDWWRDEVAWAEDYLATRERMKKSGEWNDNPYDRPGLREVQERLHSIKSDMGVP